MFLRHYFTRCQCEKLFLSCSFVTSGLPPLSRDGAGLRPISVKVWWGWHALKRPAGRPPGSPVQGHVQGVNRTVFLYGRPWREPVGVPSSFPSTLLLLTPMG